MSSAKVTELRKRPRLPISFPVFARGIDMHGKLFKELLTALNVSATGMLALISPTFSPPHRLQIELPIGILGHEARVITRGVDAEVVRIEPHVRSKLVGLKFNRPIA